MARKFLNNLDMSKNEIWNPVIHKLASAPGSPVEGQVYYDTTDHTVYIRTNSTWVDLSSSPLTAGAGLTLTGTTLDVGAGTGITVNANDIAIDTAVVPRLATSNTFTNTQIATVSGTTHAFRADVASTADTYINFRYGGTAIANIYPANSTDLKIQTTTAGTLILDSGSSAVIDMSTNRLTNVVDPSGAQDAATKAYVDSIAQGLDAKASVRVATTAAGTLASSFENGDTVDGVALATGDRILIKDQAAGAENGIYTVNASGAPTRATDANASGELSDGTYVFVEEGTANADSGWVVVTVASPPWTPGTDATTWTQFTGAGQITAGSGLTKTGNTLNVGVTGTGLTLNADDIAIDATVIPKLGSVNIFTLPQMIDLAATGNALTLDVHTGGGEKWIEFFEGGATRGYIAESLDGIRFQADNNMSIYGDSGVNLTSTGGSIALDASGGNVAINPAPGSNVTLANSPRITGLADATAATDAVNRQFGDSRYGLYYSSATHSSGTTITIAQATHGCRASQGLIVQLQEVSTGDVVDADINVSAGGDVVVTFAASQSANSIRVTIHG